VPEHLDHQLAGLAADIDIDGGYGGRLDARGGTELVAQSGGFAGQVTWPVRAPANTRSCWAAAPQVASPAQRSRLGD
jgi:hypothetical protein